MADIEKLNEIQTKKWGGARKGAGRPEHSKNPQTLEREEAARQFKERVAHNVDRLFNAQLDKALGEKYLMVKTTTGSGKDRKTTIEIVTDTELIKQYLDDDLEDTDTEYYFMTTKPADNMALDSLLNRSFGRATEKVELEHSGQVNTGTVDPKMAEEFQEFLKNRTKS